MKRMFTWACLLAVLAVSTGCGGNSVVGLVYPEQLDDTPWCRWDVSIVGFADTRCVQSLGAMDETTDYTTASDVSQWVSRSLYREMKSRGCDCIYVAKAEQGADGFIISGEILSITLDKIGLNQWSTRMEILVELTRDSEMLFGQTYTGTVERTFFLASEAPEKILAEGLSEILKDAAIKLTKAMGEASR